MTDKQREQIEKAERAKKALLDSELNAGLYLAWFLVFGETKEYAEKLLHTSLAD